MTDRIEHDALGPVGVPADRLWGAQTQRAIEHFPVSTDRFRWPRAVIRALGLVKRAAADANTALGVLTADRAALIVRAADEVIEGRLDDHFPLGAFQSGSGTQTNMNANEVIANRAIVLAGGAPGSKTPVHPNDHVNRSQSSNDVFPTVMHLAVVEELRGHLYPPLRRVHEALLEQARRHADVVKAGRTHLQDAAPLTFGQEIGGWAAQLGDALAALERAEQACHELAIGGTAVGTGLTAPPSFGERVAARLAADTGVPFTTARNRFAALAAHDAIVGVSSALRLVGGALFRIANDIRWLASGPRTAIGELRLPANEPGSSIMPGKVNPTQCEVMTMVGARVFGNDATVAFAGAQSAFQLQMFKPIMLHGVLESIVVLADAADPFTRYCLVGMAPDLARVRTNLDRDLMVVTALVPTLGYDRVAQIAQRAERDGTTAREAAIALGFLTGEEYDRLVVPADLVRPGP